MVIGAGTKLGRYEIRSKIGEGGMGEVYLAQDTQLNRTVAIKILPEDVASNQERMRRFQQEARAAAALKHPAIAHIYEIGESDGTHFIAMEYVEGETLGEKIHREKAPLVKLLRYLAQVAEGLSKAHAAGIVHRDLKPDNIMITRDGYAKILDFGLAKLIEPQQGFGSDSASSEIATALMPLHSTPGIVMGTVGYMSPEQAQGRVKEIDHRSDIFSFGCILYEAATGRKAFEGKDVLDSLHMIVHAPTPQIKDVNSLAPDELQRIVRRCLAKEPEKRYQSIKDVAIELDEIRQELKSFAEVEGSIQPSARVVAASGSSTPAEVKSAHQSAIGTTQQDVARPTSSAEYVTSEIKKHKSASIAALVLLLAIGGLGVWYFSNRLSNTSQIESIAVMPFVNASGNSDVEYLSDGMTESLINSLSQLPKLSVKARSSVFHYKGKDATPQQIGNELSVQAILNGRVVQRGENLTLSLELVDARTGNQIWGEQYNRKQADLISLQSEIARDVSNKLRHKLSGADEQKLAKNYTVNPEAYKLYLQGRYQWNKRSNEGNKKAIEYFRQAIEKDPSYALAYVGLADSYIVGSLLPHERFPKVKAAVLKALEIDDNLGEAHATLAVIKDGYEWDPAGAEREYQRAIELSPNYATAHHWYGEFLAAQGRFDESFAEYKRALELDPLSLAISTDLGIAYYYARQYDRATDHLKKLMEMDLNYVRTHFYLARVYEEKEMFEEALAAREKGLILEGENAEEVAKGKASIKDALKASGARAYWRKILDLTKEDEQRGKAVHPLDMAISYARLGERDQAFIWLEKAFAERRTDLIWLKVAPEWDNLRSDPRFAELVRRVGLTP